MSELRRLTTLWAFMACYRDRLFFFYLYAVTYSTAETYLRTTMNSSNFNGTLAYVTITKPAQYDSRRDWEIAPGFVFDRYVFRLSAILTGFSWSTADLRSKCWYCTLRQGTGIYPFQLIIQFFSEMIKATDKAPWNTPLPLWLCS
jgi:hypothetical protein